MSRIRVLCRRKYRGFMLGMDTKKKAWELFQYSIISTHASRVQSLTRTNYFSQIRSGTSQPTATGDAMRRPTGGDTFASTAAMRHLHRPIWDFILTLGITQTRSLSTVPIAAIGPNRRGTWSTMSLSSTAVYMNKSIYTYFFFKYSHF
jgi:hypothetical protein